MYNLMCMCATVCVCIDYFTNKQTNKHIHTHVNTHAHLHAHPPTLTRTHARATHARLKVKQNLR